MTAKRPPQLALVGSALGFAGGLADGVTQFVARGTPDLLASQKVSSEILWVDPAVSMIAFGIAGLGLAWGERKLPASLATRRPGLLLLMAGALVMPLATLKVLHPVSAVVMALGLVTMAARGTRSPSFTRALARAVPWMALALIGVWGVIAVADRQQWRTRLSAPGDAPRAGLDVIILMLDTVRRDRFGAAGAGPELPVLNEFGRSAVWFSNAWSTSSWSLPSQASLLTGRYPHEHGATWPDLRLADSVETLASVLAASGYATGAFSGNSSWVTPEYLGRGFARFHSQTLEDELRRTFVGRAAQPVLNAIGLHAAGRGKHAARVGEEFAAFLDDVGTRPVFAYLCFMDVNRDMHRARLNRPFWRRTAQTAEVVGAYDSALTALDAQVGLVLADLKARGRFENSIIVVASDHGESFGAGSAHDHDPSGHGTSLFPEQSAIPLWIRMPGQTPRRVDDPVTLRDVPATIVASLGLPRGAVGGRSLFDSLTSPAAAELRYHTYWGNSIAAGSWFFLEHGDSAAPQRQLFNYAEDPFATSAVEMTAVAADLQALLHRTLGRKVSQPDAAGTTAR